ncbi:MAG: NnrS family protein [Paracoccaceae bacterium]
MKRYFAFFLGDGFRAFFMGAALFAPLSLSLWLLAFFGGFDVLPDRMPAVQWHAHTLVFGYGGAVLAGFFLTAVPNWTGAKAARHVFIGVAAAVWAAGRLAVFSADLLPPVLVAGVDLAFAPILGAKIATQLIRKPKPQNVVFLLFLSLFWIGNLVLHLDWIGIATGDADAGLRVGLLALVSMIIVLGGRVTPAFTRNAMHRAGIETGTPHDPAVFTPMAIVLAALLPLSALVAGGTLAQALLFVIAGMFVLLRGLRWHTRFQWGQPILWTLHLSYGAIGLGLVLWGIAGLTGDTDVPALHFLAIGGVGGMTVSVMSRATLGHSGRPLVAPRAVALSYALIPVAAILRWMGGVMGGVTGGAAYTPLVLASGLLWCAAFALFIAALWPLWANPRPARASANPPPE